MTSRQRVRDAIRHRETDRTPIDLGAHFSTGISAFAYRNLRLHLGLEVGKIELIDPVQCLARVGDDILDRFHCDCVLLRPGFSGDNAWTPREPYRFTIPDAMHPEATPDGQWIVRHGNHRMRMPRNGFFFDGDWMSFYDGSAGSPQFEATVQEAHRIRETSDRYLLYMEFPAFFDGSVDGLCDMLTDPETVRERNEAQLQASLRQAEAVIRRMGGVVDGIALNSDLGMQQGPMCSPDVYDDLCAPYLKRFCDFIHAQSDFDIFLHSCGSIRAFLPTLIACGIDVVNPVQISAAGMDPLTLKQQYGDRLSFWGGGCDTQKVLNMENPEQVSAHVRELFRIFKPGGGFVFNQVHNIMGDIRPENIVAMFDTAYEEACRP